tara:strand:+ start:652 stop:2214 length:1563 start_codon:yes stop_codon:yes gene_type:complete
MGLVSPVRPVEYKGDGTTKRFSFPFPYDNKNDIVVELCTNGTNNWIVQSEGGSYRFVNDNTIEFKFAPKNVGGGDEQNAIKISRKTYARRVIANIFAESRPECAVVIKDCRGEYDGTDGAFTDDRDEPLRPFKVGDTITYTSPCDDGAYIYWYSKPREGLTGDHILIRTDQLEGRNDEDKTTSLTLVDSHLDKRIYVKVQCIGCGPPDGLCCEWTVETDNDVLDSNGCGLNAVVGSTSKKMLHNVGTGRGVVRVDFNSPEISRVFNITFPDGTSYDYTVGGTSKPSAHFIVSKSDASAYLIITVPNASDKGWEYSLRCTEAVDTSKYRFCRWIGSSKKYIPSYEHGDPWGPGKTKIPAVMKSPTSGFPKTSSWLEHNPGSKTDGYATINGPGIATFTWGGAAMTYGAFYFGDEPWNNVYNYQIVPWRSAYTQRGTHNGNSIYFGSLSVNNKGCPNCAPTSSNNDKTYLTHWAIPSASYSTVAGYWEFSNDTAEDKVVEASWDGDRSYTSDSELPNLTDIN